jgi:hypothetical protein
MDQSRRRLVLALASGDDPEQKTKAKSNRNGSYWIAPHGSMGLVESFHAMS